MIDQRGLRPLQNKLDVITKINTLKNEKESKSFYGGDTIPIKIYRKLIGEHRHLEKIAEEKERMDMDRRTYKRIQ